MKRIALFAGSFDPFTIGHKSIVDRALPLFGEIVIGEVILWSGLTVDAARREGAQFLLRGVRSVVDFEYERQLADINRNISGIESVLIYALPELASVSSSMVRELAGYGVDVSEYLPSANAKA